MDTCLSSSAALFPEHRLTREDYDAQRSGNVEHTWSDVLGSWLKDAIPRGPFDPENKGRRP